MLSAELLVLLPLVVNVVGLGVGSGQLSRWAVFFCLRLRRLRGQQGLGASFSRFLFVSGQPLTRGSVAVGASKCRQQAEEVSGLRRCLCFSGLQVASLRREGLALERWKRFRNGSQLLS